MIFRDFDEISSDIFYALCYKEHGIVFIGVPYTQQQQNTTFSKLKAKTLMWNW